MYHSKHLEREGLKVYCSPQPKPRSAKVVSPTMLKNNRNCPKIAFLSEIQLKHSCRRRSRKCTPVCEQVRLTKHQRVSKMFDEIRLTKEREFQFVKDLLPAGPRFLPKVLLPPTNLPLLRTQVMSLRAKFETEVIK